MKVAVIIRAYNEAAALERALKVLEQQRFDGELELIVVDNGSTDETAEVARRHGARVVRLEQSEFSYPKSLNVGIAAATAPVVMCLVAHAYPAGPGWIEAGLRWFDDARVAGVYSFVLPHLDGTVWDKLVCWPGYAWSRLRGPMRLKRAWYGDFGATNLALRRSLWEQHPFDERYGAGGEDTGWARWALSQGYAIVRDPAFTVRHSHYLRTFRQFWQQLQVWRRTEKPRPFDRAELEFRQKNQS